MVDDIFAALGPVVATAGLELVDVELRRACSWSPSTSLAGSTSRR